VFAPKQVHGQTNNKQGNCEFEISELIRILKRGMHRVANDGRGSEDE